MPDVRRYFKLTHGFTENPKIISVGPRAAWLYVCALDYCARNMTDGEFSPDAIRRFSGPKSFKQELKLLLDAGLLHSEGHGCPSCRRTAAGRLLVHDYLFHQQSADEIRKISAERRTAGKKGGQARVSNMKPKQDVDSPSSVCLEVASSKSQPEVEVEKEQLLTTNYPPLPSGGSPPSGEDTQKALPGIPPAPRKRGPAPRSASRLPADFAVTAAMVAWARQNVPHVDGRWETEKFIDHWTAASGANAVKKDWVAAWRTWMRNAADRSPQVRGVNGSASSYKPSTTSLRVAQANDLVEYYRERGE